MLAARRWGARAGGVVSAFPAIVGPVLLIDLLEHGPGFTARAAAGTLLGLLTLSAFIAVYGRLAASHGWRRALAAGWGAAAVAAALLVGAEAPALAGGALAIVSLLLAARALPRGVGAAAGTPREAGIALTMAACFALVVALAAAASALGPAAGGVLAALPVLASVLAVSTHRARGGAEAVALLRGMTAGMGGFVAFCLAIALLVDRTTPAIAFAAGTAAALVPALLTPRRGAAAREALAPRPVSRPASSPASPPSGP